jgi:hypothetical protein
MRGPSVDKSLSFIAWITGLSFNPRSPLIPPVFIPNNGAILIPTKRQRWFGPNPKGSPSSLRDLQRKCRVSHEAILLYSIYVSFIYTVFIKLWKLCLGRIAIISKGGFSLIHASLVDN